MKSNIRFWSIFKLCFSFSCLPWGPSEGANEGPHAPMALLGKTKSGHREGPSGVPGWHLPNLSLFKFFTHPTSSKGACPWQRRANLAALQLVGRTPLSRPQFNEFSAYFRLCMCNPNVK